MLVKRKISLTLAVLLLVSALSGCRSLKQLGDIANNNVGEANDNTGSTQEQVKDKSYTDPDKVVEPQH
ncbi:MAG TPA: hypothetical protein DIW17_19825 [Clostridiales bacterium]|jgi:hypothetical protein|nr:hypothetical protein [Lachnospiraceae bacterium]HCS76106.1 hypothetical protein [Clostridiales bacterium]